MSAPLPPSFQQLIRDNLASRRFGSAMFVVLAVVMPFAVRDVALSIGFDVFFVASAALLEITAQRIRRLARMLSAQPALLADLTHSSHSAPKSAHRDVILRVELTTGARYRLRVTSDPVKTVIADLEAWRVREPVPG